MEASPCAGGRVPGHQPSSSAPPQGAEKGNGIVGLACIHSTRLTGRGEDMSVLSIFLNTFSPKWSVI